MQQLSPVIKNHKALEAGFDQSLMQRLTVLGNRSFLLNQQFRMHPFLAKFSSDKFYNSLVLNGITENHRILKSKFKFPIPSKPTFFLSCEEEEQISNSGYSYLNAKEGNKIGKIVFRLLNSGIKPTQLGNYFS